MLDAVAAVPDGAHTFANTFGVIADDEAEAHSRFSSVYFPAYVASDKAIRDVRNVDAHTHAH